MSLDFETFLHNDGTLYSCFNQQGARVYVDMSQVRKWKKRNFINIFYSFKTSHPLLPLVVSLCHCENTNQSHK